MVVGFVVIWCGCMCFEELILFGLFFVAGGVVMLFFGIFFYVVFGG